MIDLCYLEDSRSLSIQDCVMLNICWDRELSCYQGYSRCFALCRFPIKIVNEFPLNHNLICLSVTQHFV